MWLRGLTIWLGAAIVGSFATTFGWFIVIRQPLDAQALVGFSDETLWFTVPGSALISIAFGILEWRGLRAPWRYITLVAIGAAAGAFILSFGGEDAVGLGAAYGLVTTLVWIGLLFALRMHRQSKSAQAEV